MKRFLFIALLIIAFSAILTGCNKEDDPQDTKNKGSIIGTVTDFATGEPVKNANVRLNPIGETTLTGSDGTFQFDNVPDGSYSLSLSKDGYLDLDDDYTIIMKNGKNVRRDVQLKNAFESFQITVNGTEIDTLKFGRNIVTPLHFSIYNDCNKEVSIKITHTSSWLSISSSNCLIQPNTSKLIDVGLIIEELVEGNNVCIININSATLSKEIVVLAKAEVPKLTQPVIVSQYAEPQDGDDYSYHVTLHSSVSDDGGIPIIRSGFVIYYRDYGEEREWYIASNGDLYDFQISKVSGFYKLTKARAYAENQYGIGYSTMVYFNF